MREFAGQDRISAGYPVGLIIIQIEKMKIIFVSIPHRVMISKARDQ